MLVLEATDQLQGLRADDYHWADTGELVHLPALDCSSPSCGCTRGFAGFVSHRATTTAKIVERPDLTIEELSLQLADSLSAGEWIARPDPGDELVAALATEIVELATRFGRFGPGAIIEREGDTLTHRLPPGVDAVDVSVIDQIESLFDQDI